MAEGKESVDAVDTIGASNAHYHGGGEKARADGARKADGAQKGLALAGRRCLFLQYAKKNAKTLSEPDWYAIISNLAVFEGGDLTIHNVTANR